MRWVLPAAATAVMAGAVIIALVVFWAGGRGADCDHAALEAAMRQEIIDAERAGALQTSVVVPAGCHDDDLIDAMPGISRSWHAMPDGTLMRQPQHEGS